MKGGKKFYSSIIPKNNWREGSNWQKKKEKAGEAEEVVVEEEQEEETGGLGEGFQRLRYILQVEVTYCFLVNVLL